MRVNPIPSGIGTTFDFLFPRTWSDRLSDVDRIAGFGFRSSWDFFGPLPVFARRRLVPRLVLALLWRLAGIDKHQAGGVFLVAMSRHIALDLRPGQSANRGTSEYSTVRNR